MVRAYAWPSGALALVLRKSAIAAAASVSTIVHNSYIIWYPQDCAYVGKAVGQELPQELAYSHMASWLP